MDRDDQRSEFFCTRLAKKEVEYHLLIDLYGLYAYGITEDLPECYQF